MAITYIGSFSLSAGPKSTNTPIPMAGKPTTMRITNIGGRLCFVLPGVGDSLAINVGDGIAIPPSGGVDLNIDTNTYLAFITFRGNTDLNLVLGR